VSAGVSNAATSHTSVISNIHRGSEQNVGIKVGPNFDGQSIVQRHSAEALDCTDILLKCTQFKQRLETYFFGILDHGAL